MKLRFVTGLAAVCFAAVLFGQASQAEAKTCYRTQSACINGKTVKNKGDAPHYVWSKQKRKWVLTGRVARVATHRNRRVASRGANQVLPKARQQVVATIKSMAPSYGVPTWFALRIAKVESGYNPRARGRAGEYGVFQLKCATARGIGFRGNCSGLLNASTNIRFGLKHLQLAVRGSRGNLKLAASKHNGGLGRRSLVRAYVRRVF
jgi:soluble lytic murein transglycosylase-like protein